jgi:diguanylate cyclase (GGDEF)-like protein
MAIDVSTLFLVTIYVEAILGLLLLFVWVQNPSIKAVAWWGCSHLMRAGSISLFGMYGTFPDFVSIDLANAMLLTSFAVTWSGARVFDNRPIMPFYMLYGAFVWLCLSHIATVAHWPDLRALVSAGIIAGYTWMTAYEFWRARQEALVSRWPTIFMLFAHGALFLLRTPLVTMLPWSPTNQVFGSIWLTVISSEALLFTISIAFLLLAMAKERAELYHKAAAVLDQLTGISNRRGFLSDCDRLAKSRAATSQPQPYAVLLLDLDHFKRVNDTFGHAAGDAVLQRFAQGVNSMVRPTDLFGRLGGEEFAMVLVNVGGERATVIAERIRSAVEQMNVVVDGRRVPTTVSIGIAMCNTPKFDITELLSLADQALYRAKNLGRNRIERAATEREWRLDETGALFAPPTAKPAMPGL